MLQNKKLPPDKFAKQLQTIRKLYEQQHYMYENKAIFAMSSGVPYFSIGINDNIFFDTSSE